MKYNKKNYQNRQWLGVVIAVIIILSSCSFINCVSGMSNPAAVYCNELGYKYVVKETGDGQRGFCQFPDGSAVDGWKFFTGEEGQEYGYCEKQGYETKTVSGEQCQYSSKCAVCVLKDGTETNVTELMELNLNSTVLPWDPGNQTNGETGTNYLLYFFGVVILVVFLAIAFVFYKKRKDRDDYYE